MSESNTIQVSHKLNDGTIVVIGGNSFDDFYANVAAIVGPDNADDVVGTFSALIPSASTGKAQAYTGNTSEARPGEGRPGAGNPPGDVPLCPSHQQQATWREGGISTKTNQPYQGFWKCPVTDQGITFNGKMKSSCPPPRN